MGLVKRLLVTVFLLLVYKGGSYISLVPNDPIIGGLIAGGSYSLFTMGMTSILSGFFLTELIFLTIPRLRKIRSKGFKGRETINDWSLAVSFIMATAQSAFAVQMLSTMKFIDRSGFYVEPTLLPMLTHTLFFIAGFVLLVAIGKLINKYGIGNGFTLIIAMNILAQTSSQVVVYLQTAKINYLNVNFIGFIFLAVIIYGLIHLVQNKDWNIEIKNEKITSIQLPFFLQSMVTLTLSYNTIYILSNYIPKDLKLSEFFNSANPWQSLMGRSLLIIVFSLFCHLMFTSKKRIASSLNINEISFELNKIFLPLSTLSLIILMTLLQVQMPFEDYSLIPISIVSINLFYLISVGLDLKSQMNFTSKNPNYVEAFELDNVFLAAMLKNKCESLGIPLCIQSYYFRRMYFFFEPFIKMKCLVNEENKAQVIEILHSTNAKVI